MLKRAFILHIFKQQREFTDIRPLAEFYVEIRHSPSNHLAVESKSASCHFLREIYSRKIFALLKICCANL